MSNPDKPLCGSTSDLLRFRQKLPLKGKIYITRKRIKEWYEYYDGQVYVAFSGGKDSVVLRHLVLSMYPEVPCVFVNTGLEYPEIVDFVKKCAGTIWLKPAMSFQRVIEKYGYPVVSKSQSCAISRYHNTNDPLQKYRRLNGWPKGKRGVIFKKWQYLINAPFKISDACCTVMKKAPLNKYGKQSGRVGMTGVMVVESNPRKTHYLKYGCNAFDLKVPLSRPLAFWSTSDIWAYINEYDLPYSKIYDMGEPRTGCMACMFGVHLEPTPNRFQRMKISHPKHWNAFINGMGLGVVLDFIGVPYE